MRFNCPNLAAKKYRAWIYGIGGVILLMILANLVLIFQNLWQIHKIRITRTLICGFYISALLAVLANGVFLVNFVYVFSTDGIGNNFGIVVAAFGSASYWLLTATIQLTMI